VSGAFHGAKAILIAEGRLVVMRRDDRDDIPWPGRVDLPGGGAEPGESPEACAVREVAEETAVVLDPGGFHWRRFFPRDGLGSWFLAADLSPEALDGLRLGDEGTELWHEPVTRYLGRVDAIPHHQARVAGYLEAVGAMEKTDCRTPTPGKRGVTRIPTWKFQVIREVILQILEEAPPEGFAFAGLTGAVRSRLAAETLENLGSVGWHTATVKLELEVAGEIARVPGATPQRLIRSG
jgi:8-oxo-dGTP diphosphatase